MQYYNYIPYFEKMIELLEKIDLGIQVFVVLFAVFLLYYFIRNMIRN